MFCLTEASFSTACRHNSISENKIQREREASHARGKKSCRCHSGIVGGLHSIVNVILEQLLMVARCRDEYEVAAVAEVLHVGKAPCLSPRAFEFRDRKSIALNELGIDSARIFAGGDPSLEE